MSDPLGLARRLLASHAGSTPAGSPTGFEWARHFARAIDRDPQAHIDALVEAGVLGKATPALKLIDELTGPFYVVVQPHKHEWRVTEAMPDDRLRRCYVGCECGESRQVPNRLPIEVPD